MDVKQEAIKNINNIENSPKIYRPKPKRLCNSYNIITMSHNKHKKDNKKNYKIKKGNIANSKNKPKLDFDQLSIEEIESDFSKLKAKSEAYKVKKELLYLLRNSNSDNFGKDANKETIKIKRPKNPFFENINES